MYSHFVKHIELINAAKLPPAGIFQQLSNLRILIDKTSLEELEKRNLIEIINKYLYN